MMVSATSRSRANKLTRFNALGFMNPHKGEDWVDAKEHSALVEKIEQEKKDLVSASVDEGNAFHKRIKDLVAERDALKAEKVRQRDLLFQVQSYLAGYDNDADDATHAKRVIANYLNGI